MSDFAYDYFNNELDKLAVPELTQIFEKVKPAFSKNKFQRTSFHTSAWRFGRRFLYGTRL